MSTLYTGSAAVLNDFLRNKSPLASLVYSSQLLPDKQKKAAYALLFGTLRYKSVLEDVLDASNFMSLDRKMNRALVLLMMYDMLFGETKSIAGGGAVKKMLVQHSNHMRTALARIKVARGAAADEELLPREIRFSSKLPRYVRINTLRTTDELVHALLQSEGYTLSPVLFDRHSWSAEDAAAKLYYRDLHVAHLLVFAPGTDLHEHELLLSGRVVLQDKASCMPAAALDPCGADYARLDDGQPWHVIDTCAAPGNKTTHLLAIALEHLRRRMPAAAADAVDSTAATAAVPAASSASGPSSEGKKQQSHFKKPRSRGPIVEEADEHDGGASRPKATGRQVDFALGGAGPSAPPVFKLEAFEVDPTRFQLLHKMMSRALPTPHTSSVASVLPGGAAAAAAPSQPPCPPCPPATVSLHNRSFLDVDPLDPRYRTVRAVLLDPTCSGSGMLHKIEQWYKHRVDEKSQRTSGSGSNKKSSSSSASAKSYGSGVEKASVAENVEALAAFQKEIVQHAMKFPNVQIISYSTCSIHSAEDECVVSACLSSESGRPFALSPALPTWFRRGGAYSSGLSDAEAAKCVRVAGAEDGMNGFFVARFVRKGAPNSNPKPKGKKAKASATPAAPSAAAAAKSAAPASQQSKSQPQAGQKRARDDGDDDADANENEEDSAAASTTGSDAPKLGSQTSKNKKKREKAKLKKQKMEAETKA